MKKIIYIMVLITALSCSTDDVEKPKDTSKSFVENFDSLDNFNTRWEDDSLNTPISYYLDNGNLKFTTQANDTDRSKVRTIKDYYNSGTYTWRVYAPNFEINGRCSIGAFLYNYDNQYEFDFEIGSGNSIDRAQLNATETDLILYCTSQIFPNSKSQFLIEHERWYDLKMELSTGENNNFLIKWYLDNVLLKSLQTDIDSDNSFRIHNSLENLGFTGDNITTRLHYTLFDSVKFTEN